MVRSISTNSWDTSLHRLAKIAGMMEDLELTGPQYNIALTVFFLPYAVFEVPSNIVLKLMRPSWWICILMVSWGVVMTLQGIVKDYHGLIITRTMLGSCILYTCLGLTIHRPAERRHIAQYAMSLPARSSDRRLPYTPVMPIQNLLMFMHRPDRIRFLPSR